MKTATTIRLLEYADLGSSARVDRANGVIRGVRILGHVSRNGRTYTRDAMVNAIGMYEGAKVNVNHPGKGEGNSRPYEARIGVIRNVTYRDGEGLSGDFHFNPQHALAPQLIWDATKSPTSAGFSHNAEGNAKREGGKMVVEAITKVHSVDLVADPATTRGLFESISSADRLAVERGWPDAMTSQQFAAVLRGSHVTKESIQEFVDRACGQRRITESERSSFVESLTRK